MADKEHDACDIVAGKHSTYDVLAGKVLTYYLFIPYNLLSVGFRIPIYGPEDALGTHLSNMVENSYLTKPVVTTFWLIIEDIVETQGSGAQFPWLSLIFSH